MSASKDPTDLGFPPKGSLQRVSFPRILRQIMRTRSSGSLYLLSGQTKKIVFFEEGQPLFVRSNVLAECLGQVLAKDGLITDRQCEQTLETVRRTGKKQGQLLVEMGILSEGNLRYGLQAQLRRKLFDVFGWTNGRYQYKPGPITQDFGARLVGSTTNLILSAILENFSEEQAESALEPIKENFPIHRGEEPEDMELLPGERHFLRSLDGSRSVNELLNAPIAPAPPARAALIHALVQCGLCQISKIRRQAKPAVPMPIDARTQPDEVFLPHHEATNRIAEFEDTPLPGKLPSKKETILMEDSFFVEDASHQGISTDAENRPDFSELDTGAPDALDEAFADEVMLLDAQELEFVEDNNVTDSSPIPRTTHRTTSDLVIDEASAAFDDLAASSSANHVVPQDLINPNDPASLESVDLRYSEEELAAVGNNFDSPSSSPSDNPEILGAIEFNKGQASIEAGDFGEAISHLESAYEYGIDVADLHAMLAYARFKASGDEPELAEHAIELLAYAEDMNPELDLVHAYRGAVLHSGGDRAGAQSALTRAVELNDRCKLALELLAEIKSAV